MTRHTTPGPSAKAGVIARPGGTGVNDNARGCSRVRQRDHPECDDLAGACGLVPVSGAVTESTGRELVALAAFWTDTRAFDEYVVLTDNHEEPLVVKPARTVPVGMAGRDQGSHKK